MGASSFTQQLGRLLSDRSEREQFGRDPEGWVRAFAPDPADRAALLALDREDLELQAGMLLEKRAAEVAGLVPRTWARSGEEFPRYAGSSWPQGHQRHLIDALGFCRHLGLRGRAACPGEERRIAFLLGGGRFACSLLRGVYLRGKPRRAIQVLYRGPGGAVSGLHLFLAL